MQKMMGLMRKCIDDYHMISPGDKIAVGVSGGKDSLTLLTVLAALRSYYPAPFELAAITIDMGLSGMDFSTALLACWIDSIMQSSHVFASMTKATMKDCWSTTLNTSFCTVMLSLMRRE